MEETNASETQPLAGTGVGPGEQTRRPPGPMSMCPMSFACERMMKKPPARFFVLVPGLVLVLVGVLILIEPKVLIWLAAAASILLGALLLMMGNFVRKIANQFRESGSA